MTRYTWGSPDGKPISYHITVAEDSGNGNAFKRGTPSSAYPLKKADGSTANDFLLWNPIDQAYNIAATSLTTDSLGYPPAFKGPDEVKWLYAPDGSAIQASDAGGAGSGASTVEELTDATTVGKAVVKATSQANARTAIGAAAASDVTTLTTAVNGKLDADDLNAEMEGYLDTSGRPTIIVIGADDPLPAVQNGSIVLRLGAGSVTGTLAVTSVLAEAIGAVTAGGTGTTTATPAALGANAVCLALVAAYQSTATSADVAPLPTSFTAMGLTWTAVSLSTSTTTNGVDSARLYIGTGAGTATKPVVGFAEAMTGVHIRIVQIANATGTVVQSASAQATGGTASPSATLPSPVSGSGVVVSWIIQNNATNSQTPGTGFTEVGAATSSTGIRVSGEYRIPGTQTATWTKAISPSQYQALVVAVEVR